jgi:hypothetical protein
MGLMNEYIDRKMGAQGYIDELIRLISAYNQRRGAYLFVFSAAISKTIPAVGLIQDDYYIIHDLLNSVNDVSNVDIYLETPGGSGETAEEIVEFLHGKFQKVSFVISGEAKSAGTIMVLGADEILMTNTGSLGPIDAQMQIGRSRESAYDYIEWVDTKRQEAEKAGSLNPFDAMMVAQITPGELTGVKNALDYAKDLVKRWLPKYKFKDWDFTKKQKIPVTEEMKIQKAEEIADLLCKHSEWRSHGRSIKIDSLSEKVGLDIIRIDDDPILADIVYRIQTVIRLLFETTTTFKIFATKDYKIFRNAAAGPKELMQHPQNFVAEIQQKCPQCGKEYHIYAKFVEDPDIDKDFQNRGYIQYPKDNKLKCDCGYEIDLSGIRNQIEMDIGKKIIV